MKKVVISLEFDEIGIRKLLRYRDMVTELLGDVFFVVENGNVTIGTEVDTRKSDDS